MKRLDPRRHVATIANYAGKKAVGFGPVDALATVIEDFVIAPITDRIPVAGWMIRRGSRFVIPGDYDEQELEKAKIWMQELQLKIKARQEERETDISEDAANVLNEEEIGALDATVSWLAEQADVVQAAFMKFIDRDEPQQEQHGS